MRHDADTDNLCARGAYLIGRFGAGEDVTLLATGSEVHIAMDAARMLETDGLGAAVVSMPCWEMFERQSAAYRRKVLGKARRIAVEAASPFGWTRYVDSEDDVVGMIDFGASAPADALYQRSGITPEGVAARALDRLSRRPRSDR